MKSFFRNKTILITGGTGSIGSALVIELLRMKCKVVRVVSNDENGLYDLSQTINKIFYNIADFESSMLKNKIRYFLGDIRDYERCKEVTKGVDIVINAAALKHVTISEYNSKEVLKTNVVGTENIINSSIENKVKKVMHISTDKVVNPVGIMGTSKLYAERSILNASQTKGNSKTKFSCVRFGNILGSRGSVLPKFLDLINNKKDLVIYHPEMSRFVMTIEDCVKMILKSLILMRGNEIFILKSMKCFKILDLAKALFQHFNVKKNKLKVLKKNNLFEKIYEQLFTDEESHEIKKKNDFLIIDKKNPFNKNIKNFQKYQISNSNYLTPKEIIFFLKKNRLI